MLFAIYAQDKQGMVETRLALRPPHLDYMATIASNIHFAGPLLDDTGTLMIGSLIIADFTDRAALDAWLAAEPFCCGGLFATVTIRPLLKTWPNSRAHRPN